MPNSGVSPAEGPPPPPNGGLAGSVTGGVKWTAGAQAVVQALVLMRAVVLARLLAPEEFGKFALITAFFTVATLLSESGLGAALIQRPVLRAVDLDTVFWLQFGLALASGGLLASSGPAIASVFNEPELRDYASFLGVTVALSTWTSVHWALLQRDMRFRAIAIREVIATTLGIAVAVIIAASRRDAWALIAGTATTAIISNFAVVAASRWRPAFRFDRSVALDVIRYSGHLLSFQFVVLFTRQADNLLVGRYLGASALGLYSRGYQVLLYPLRQASSVVGRVMFPALSSMQASPERFRSGYLRAVGGICLVAYPALAGLIVVAPDFVAVLLGDQWTGVVPLVRLFALAGLLESVTSSVGWIYQSLGRTRLQLVVGTTVALFVLAGVSVGVAVGTVTAVAVAYAAMTVIWAGPALVIPGRLIGMTLWDVARAASTPAFCSAVMAGAVALARMGMSSFAPAGRLAISAILGAAIYAAAVWLMQPSALRDLRRGLRVRNETLD